MLSLFLPHTPLGFAPARAPAFHHAARRPAATSFPRMEVDIERKTGDNVEQIKDTQRDKVMTFSYDMSLEPAYEKPTYPGTGNGLGGETVRGPNRGAAQDRHVVGRVG